MARTLPLMGARLNDMRSHEAGGATFAQAAFRWVPSNLAVTGVVISMTSRERIDESLAASCTARPCAGACPHGLAPELLTAETHRLLA